MMYYRDSRQFDLDELIRIYDDTLAPLSESTHIRSGYSGVGLQGASKVDHFSVFHKGNAYRDLEVFNPTKVKRLRGFLACTLVKNNWCIGEYDEILDYLKHHDCAPIRYRVAELQSDGLYFHRDDNEESWRFHIALKTCPDAVLEWQDDETKAITTFHMPADGYGYWIRTDITHRAYNPTNFRRVHLIADVSRPIPYDGMSISRDKEPA